MGSCNSSINIGLYYKNELVSVMIFNKIINNAMQNSINFEYELLRFCNILELDIIESSSELFNYFINTYNPCNIITYDNLDISNEDLFKLLKFSETTLTIDYWWSKNGKKISKDNLINDEIMINKGYYKIYNSGYKEYQYLNTIE